MNVLKNGPTRQPLAHAESAVAMHCSSTRVLVFPAARRGAHYKLFELHAYAMIVPPCFIYGTMMIRETRLAGVGAGAGAALRCCQAAPSGIHATTTETTATAKRADA